MLFWKTKVKKTFEIDKNNLPQHIAIIMDGNGRWAKNRGLPRSMGHREGAKVLKEIANTCGEMGIKYLTVYAFSKENWKRPKDEIDYLMELLIDYFRNIEGHIKGKSVRVRVIGDIKGLPASVQEEIRKVEKRTEHHKTMTLNLAINYGARDEIKNAVKRIAQDTLDQKVHPDEICEETISRYLYTYDMPDPELLIRTSGEKRLSNYLLWQCAYTEFFYTNILWPDFKPCHIEEAVMEFQKRNRRYGGI